MKRIYSNYSDEEYEKIKMGSEAYGMSMSAFQKYCTNYFFKNDNGKYIDYIELVNMMKDNLNTREEGEFVVSALFPCTLWFSLTKSQQNTMSMQLKKIVESNPDKFEYTGIKIHNTKQYRKL